MISIALCTYNGEKHLVKQLESIAVQTLPPDELVVCDDCSSDRTIEILDEFRGRVPFPVHIHRNEENLGSKRNFERAISLCSGDIIALCDQDDIWKPDKLTTIESIFENKPNIGYVFSDAELVDENLNPLGTGLWEAVGFRNEFADRFVSGEQLSQFLRMSFVTGATMAFHARLKDYIFPFPEEKGWIHDGWIAVVSSSLGWDGVPISQQLISYRQHQGQQMGAPESKGSQTLRTQFKALRISRKTLVQEWLTYTSFFIYLHKHLYRYREENFPALENSIKIIEEFLVFFHTRERKIFAGNTGEKLLAVLREFTSGRYRKFANGWKSAVADLLL